MSEPTKQALEAAREYVRIHALPSHFHCDEDCWLSCPLHPESCNDDKTECDCMLEERRERQSQALARLLDQWAERQHRATVRHICRMEDLGHDTTERYAAAPPPTMLAEEE